MQWWEILIIIVIASFVLFIFGERIYKYIKHIPVEDCDCGHKGKNLKKWYKKTYGSSKCNCSCQMQNENKE